MRNVDNQLVSIIVPVFNAEPYPVSYTHLTLPTIA